MTAGLWWSSLGTFACSDANVAIGTSIVEQSGVGRDSAVPELDSSNPAEDARDPPPVDGGICAFADAVATRRPVTVWLVVERSIIMQTTRQPSPWDRLTTSLVGDSGLVRQADPFLLFGLVRHGCDRSASTCPALEVVPPATNNRDAIAAALAGTAGPRDVAMASYALEQVYESIFAASSGPTSAVVVVRHSNTAQDLICLSDGMDAGDASLAMMRSYEAAHRITALGVPVFAIDFEISPTFGLEPVSDRLAQIGGTGQLAYHVTSLDEGSADSALAAALEDVARTATSCQFRLDGKVEPGEECAGVVWLDDRALLCNDANGWRMQDVDNIELVGDACASVRSKPQSHLSARFPCAIYSYY
jgi:hypothetical protein